MFVRRKVYRGFFGGGGYSAGGVCTFLGNVSRSFDHGKCPAFIVSDDTKHVCGSCPGETQKRCGCGSNDRSTGLLFSAGIRR